MSNYDEMIKKIDQELEDIEYVEREAGKRGMYPGDYDLFSALSARKEDRQREEIDLENKLAKDLATPTPSPGPPTASSSGSGGTIALPKTTVGGHDVTPPTTATATTDLRGSLYTNVDPLSYQMELERGGISMNTDDPLLTKTWAEHVAKSNYVPSPMDLADLSSTGGDKTGVLNVKGNLDMKDPEIQQEVKDSPQVQAWNIRYKDYFDQLPDEYIVVEDKANRYGDQQVRYIQPKITKEFLQKHYKVPELDTSQENPYLERERKIRDFFGTSDVNEIKDKYGVDLKKMGVGDLGRLKR